MWWMKQTLVQQLRGSGIERKDGIRAPNGYSSKTAKVYVTDFDPCARHMHMHVTGVRMYTHMTGAHMHMYLHMRMLPTGAPVPRSDYDNEDDSRGVLEGTCVIRRHEGRRSLFFDLTIQVPWCGVTDEGTADERYLGGKTRIWNVTHYNELDEWKHLNSRNTRPPEVGPAADAIAMLLAPAICAMLKTKVQEVLGMLMFDRIDPQMLAPPPKPAKPIAASRAWGKGTVDYSKWDHLSDDDDDDDERLVEVA